MIVISAGCPSGIGPEIGVAAAAKLRDAKLIVADWQLMLQAAEVMRVPTRLLRPYQGEISSKTHIYVHSPGSQLNPRDRRPGKPTRRSGAAQLSWIREAFRLVKSQPGAALVTAPVNKSTIAGSGAPLSKGFRGHTEFLQKLDRAPYSVMCFAAPAFWTALVTTHVPLRRVSQTLSVDKVSQAILELGRALPPKSRLVVAALNPHAGEDGLLGDEEKRVILPAIRRSQRALPKTTISGPLGAETAFRKAHAGVYDGVVAMYHDQATVPLKLIAFNAAVNVTLGLSFVRTSVDHGTAYDIAGSGTANAKGMTRAIKLANGLRVR